MTKQFNQFNVVDAFKAAFHRPEAATTRTSVNIFAQCRLATVTVWCSLGAPSMEAAQRAATKVAKETGATLTFRSRKSISGTEAAFTFAYEPPVVKQRRPTKAQLRKWDRQERDTRKLLKA